MEMPNDIRNATRRAAIRGGIKEGVIVEVNRCKYVICRVVIVAYYLPRLFI